MAFKFVEMLKNASNVTLVIKNIIFLKILNFVQGFVKYKVSLADGILRDISYKYFITNSL
jgi:hypothetical protein